MELKQRASLQVLLKKLINSTSAREDFFEEHAQNVPDDERNWFLVDAAIMAHNWKRSGDWVLNIPSADHKQILIDFTVKAIPLADEKEEILKPLRQIENVLMRLIKGIPLLGALQRQSRKEEALIKETMEAFANCKGERKVPCEI